MCVSHLDLSNQRREFIDVLPSYDNYLKNISISIGDVHTIQRVWPTLGNSLSCTDVPLNTIHSNKQACSSEYTTHVHRSDSTTETSRADDSSPTSLVMWGTGRLRVVNGTPTVAQSTSTGLNWICLAVAR